MRPEDVAHRRLHSLHLSGARFESAEDVVRWLGAVQSQDFAGGKWAVGQRASDLTDADLDQAVADGRLLRTHILRPTWHFVLPEDIRWLLDLTAPRVHALNAHYYRINGLDAQGLATSQALLATTLRDGNHHTRKQLQPILERAGFPAHGLGLAYVLMHAELNGVICSGAPRGKQQTYALLDERAPVARQRTPDEALAELTRRYFTSHGPATTKDFRWWSSLTEGEIKRGLAMLGSQLEHETIDGATFWFDPGAWTPAPSPAVYLLQGYDEYFVAHSATKHLLDLSGAARAWLQDRRVAFTNGIVLDSQVVGNWKRSVSRRNVVVEADLVRSFDAGQLNALQSAVDEYGRYLGVPAQLALGD